jgi:hypothetical protein
MNSEKVELLCFLLLFPHGEAGYTNTQKDQISLLQYVMAGLMRPEKIYGQWMTAVDPQIPGNGQTIPKVKHMPTPPK